MPHKYKHITELSMREQVFGLNRNDSKDKTYSDYIADLQNKIKDVFDIVNRNANKSRDKQKAYYDLKGLLGY